MEHQKESKGFYLE